MSERLAEQVFREASESIDVLSAPLDAVVAEARGRRRRRRRTVAVGVAVAVVVVGSATWLSTRSTPGPEPDAQPEAAEVVRTPNPVDVAWYAGGLLHLDDVTVELPQLTDLAQVSTGAVYGDTSGAIELVKSDGERRLLGHKVPGARMVVDANTGWAAWVDPGGDVPALVVYDVYDGAVLATLDLPTPARGFADLDEAAHPIAIDQEKVFYVTQDGEFSWAPPDGEPAPLERAGLLDVEAATRVYDADGGIEMVQPFFSVSYRVPGHGARLSFGGSYVLSAKPSDRPDGEPFEPLVYDVRSGDRLASGIGPEELAVDATFGGNHSVVYLVAQRADLEGGADLDGNVDPLLVLRSCDLGTANCVDIVPVPTSTGRALLAH